MEPKLYISDIKKMENPDCYEYIVSRLPDYRRQLLTRFKSEKVRRLSALAGTLLCTALEAENINPYTMEYTVDENHKPYFKNMPEIHFSLSHSGEYALCLISDNVCGCDIEEKKEYRADIVQRFFHKNEYEYLTSLKDKELQADYFYRLWTLKECFLKITGKGMQLPLNSFQINFVNNCPIVIQHENTIEYRAAEYFCVDNYAISAIVSHQSALPQILYKEIYK